MKNCKNCGHENAVDAKFCMACGKTLGDSATQNDNPTRKNVLPGNFLLDYAKPQYGNRNHSAEKAECLDVKKTQSFFSCFTDAFKNYANFSGRASRKQFWIFFLLNFLISIIIDFSSLCAEALAHALVISGLQKKLGFFSGLAEEIYEEALSSGMIETLYSSGDSTFATAKILAEISSVLSVVAVLYGLVVIIPGLSISWRRMHDINKSGAWIFISFVPIIGWIWVVVLLCQPSDEYENEFGVLPGVFNERGTSTKQGNKRDEEACELIPQNNAKIIKIVDDVVFVGCNDGSFFEISVKELNFQPIVGDSVSVFTNGNAKFVTKEALF